MIKSIYSYPRRKNYNFNSVLAREDFPPENFEIKTRKIHKSSSLLDKHSVELPIRFKVRWVEISFAEKVEGFVKCLRIYQKEGVSCGWTPCQPNASFIHCQHRDYSLNFARRSERAVLSIIASRFSLIHSHTFL